MRRRWLLGGFALFVLGAALPAEIRQCLPLRTACTLGAKASCPSGAAASSAHAARDSACPRIPACPQRGVAPAPAADCRLTPTPPLRADAGAPTLPKPVVRAWLVEPEPAPLRIVPVPEPPRARTRFVSSPARPPEGCRPPPAAATSVAA